MGYLIFNTDRDDEMQSVRHNMRRMMRGGGYSPMMRHEEERDKMYEHGYRAGWEDAEDKILQCARKAKACEIAVESERIAQGKAEDPQPDNQSKGVIPVAETVEETVEKKKAAVPEKQSSEGKPKSKAIIAAAIIGVLVIGGAIFAMTHGKSGGSQEASTDVTSEASSSSGSGEVYTGDLIAVDNGPELTWDTGSAVLTNYQLEKSEYDGDCVNLYFEYSKTGGEDGSFLDDVEVSVFQNGYELDEKSSMTVDAEDNAFSEVKSGAKITVADGFMLNDATDLTVLLTAYDKDWNKIVERTQLTIPADKAKDITGNAKYFEETGETPIKDGISLKDSSGELKLTGYKWNEYEGDEMLVLYFDYTNLLDEETSMGESDFNVTVFQNGVEQEDSGWSSTTAESHFFSKIQKDVTMHCAYSYSLSDKSDIDVKFTCYSDDGEKTEEQTVSIK